MADKQSRVILWCVPRSVSTAFEVCMSKLDSVQVMYEPFITALLLGPDIQDKPADFLEMRENMNKITSNFEVICDEPWESESFTFKYAKENVLEAEYPGKKVIFVKDMSFAITENLNMIPKGYRHAFLIRSPEKVFPSWKKLLSRFTGEKEAVLKAGDFEVISKGYAFGESLQVYEHLVQSGIEPNPLLIDADDLLENPESILRQFCSFAGIEYTDKLLSWKAGSSVTKDWKMSKEILQWNKVANWHKNTFESTQFGKPSAAPSRSEMTEDVIDCIEASLPFYKKLHALRTMP